MLMTLRWLLRLTGTRNINATIGQPYTTTFRVMPTDLDILLHMNNGRYLSVLDAGRTSYLVKTGLWRQLRARKWHPVVAAQTIVYRRSLTFGTKYDVRSTFVGFDAKNGYFEQAFVVDGREYASAVVAIRFLDESGKSVPTPEMLALEGEWALPAVLPEWATALSDAVRPA
ncbi:thioesterase family protein [Actinomycetes bacterium M1A6_2h]